jgi:hypothetical protein
MEEARRQTSTAGMKPRPASAFILAAADLGRGMNLGELWLRLKHWN